MKDTEDETWNDAATTSSDGRLVIMQMSIETQANHRLSPEIPQMPGWGNPLSAGIQQERPANID